MAAMYNQRLLHHAIADNAAIAAPVERKDIVRDHACGVCFGRMTTRAVYRSVPVTETSMGCHTCAPHAGRGSKILRSGLWNGSSAAFLGGGSVTSNNGGQGMSCATPATRRWPARPTRSAR